MSKFSIGTSFISFSDDGKYCIAGSWATNNAKLWNMRTGICQYTLEGHTGSVTSASFSTNGKYCVTCSRDKSVKIWNVEDGTCLQTLKATTNNEIYNAVLLSNDNFCLTSSVYDTTLWELETETCIWNIKRNFDIGTEIVVLDDGKSFFTGSNHPADLKATIRNINDGRCISSFKAPAVNHLWSFPFCLIQEKYTNCIYKIYRFNYNENSKPAYIDTIYSNVGILVWKCNFQNIKANKKTKKILIQYGAEIELAD